MTSTKRLVIKVFVAVVLIIITALTLIVLFSLLPRPMPVFNFLGGQIPLHHVKDNSYRIDFYSFKANINSINKEANAELASLGYTERNTNVYNSFYKLREWESPDKSVCVRITDKQRIKVFADPQTSQYSSPDRYWEYYEDGWITVEVRQRRRDIHRFLYRLIW
jgi:hypothetical protein